MRNQDQMDKIAPGATMKILLFAVTALICLLFLIGLVTVGLPALTDILGNSVELIENPASPY